MSIQKDNDMNVSRESGGGMRNLGMLITILLVSLAVFCYGYLAQRISTGNITAWKSVALALIPIGATVVSLPLWTRRNLWWPWVRLQLEHHTDNVDSIKTSQLGWWIVLAAGVSLYLELMMIRIQAECSPVFAYYKNVSLLSCFLGLGIGYTKGSRRPLATPFVMPGLALQIVLLYLIRSRGALMFYLRNPISERVALGLLSPDTLGHVLTVYGFITFFFILNSLCFVPVGHLVSRLMARQDKLVSYGWNLAGSLLGIAFFYLLSALWAPASIWIALAAIAVLVFLRKHTNTLLPSVFAALIALAVVPFSFHPNRINVYSPYQLITMEFAPARNIGSISANIKSSNIPYQSLWSYQAAELDAEIMAMMAQYELPYLIKPMPDSVLIVGSGAGNDVAAAVRNQAGEIDAVEIDPAILRYGKLFHPDRPYQSSNVNAVVNDARAYIRHTDKTYDLIVYGLLDSHNLLSAKSGVRLDSYVYTVEAFREARARLRDGGVIAMTFSGGWVRPELRLISKLHLMLREAFDGQSAAVYAGRDSVGLFIGTDFELPSDQLPVEFTDITDKIASGEFQADKGTDDWPFFYMPVRKYPISYVSLILVLLAISLLFVRQLVSESSSNFSVPCFLLGAGFMLVETKAITELALVYGSTWVVVGVVIAAILCMAFTANLLVIKKGVPHPAISYGLLLLTIIVGLNMSSTSLSGVTLWWSRVIMTAVLTLPLFFSGFAFSAELRQSVSVGVALSSNLLGAMVGGFLEYNSMYFGYRSLYYIALALYAIAFIVVSVRSKTTRLAAG